MLGWNSCAPLSLVAVTLACQSQPETSARTTLSVYAASSLTEAFAALEQHFERRHPQLNLEVTFAGSQVLRLQLEQGARADLFASANEAHMAALSAAGFVSESWAFANNALVVVVPKDNPAEIGTFQDLPHANRLVVGTSNAPVGIYTRLMLQRARQRLGDGFSAAVEGHVVSEESNVRLVRAKVELGEADAAIVYRTDAADSRDLKVVRIPDEINVAASYPIGIVSRTNHPGAARKFVRFVLSSEGQEVLREHGFLAVAP